jgi:hypothetical protein
MNLFGPIAFGATLTIANALSSAYEIYVRGEFEATYGREGTFYFALVIAGFIGILGAVCFLLGSRWSRTSVSWVASILLGVGVAVAFFGSSLLIPPEMFGKLWRLPWVLLCVLSALAPALHRSLSVGRARGR